MKLKVMQHFGRGINRCSRINFRQISCSPQHLQSDSTGSSSSTTGTTGGDNSAVSAPVSPVPLAPVYDGSIFEKPWIERWNKSTRNTPTDAPVFRMILPPPNVTGKLHLGHALNIAIQDTIARWKVMQGYKVEWIPGFDHAGIATHSVASRKHQHLGKSQDFKESIQQFAVENMESIKSQLQSFGAILDWDNSYYTLDDAHSIVVKEAFLQLLESGLIQRCDGLVNWSCSLESSVADIEVDKVDFDGKMSFKVPNNSDLVEFGVLHFVAYKVENSDAELVVATSRPETIYGDVAIAVNPMDARYSHLVGSNVINPLTRKTIPVISDERVKTDFGTGAVKITPAHDKLDFTIGSTHNLPRIDIFTNDGFLNEYTGDLKGMPRFEARKKVLNILTKTGALKDHKEYSGTIGICSRTGDVIEPKVLPHWFLKTKGLTERFISAINDKTFIISPNHFSVHLVNQLSNPPDWCLSRQIKWGHRIPVYRHVNHPEEWVSAMDFESAKLKISQKYNIQIQDNAEIIQDPDVLDTWFSSSLIPLALSDWPDSKEVKNISLLETGNDILLFWVWRMVMTSLALVDQFPFNHVLLHGIVCDKYGRKMSKSRGNVIDPLHIINGFSFEDLIKDATKSVEVGELQQDEFELKIEAIEKDFPEGFRPFGRDALRFALLSQNISNDQITLDTSYLDSCRHFSNKMWQALRFYAVHKGLLKKSFSSLDPPNHMSIDSVADLWLLSCLYEFSRDAQNHLDNGHFHLYAESVRKFFYQQLCDVYIELVKNDLFTGTDKEQHLTVMQFVFGTALKISHPIMPFVTEQIWSRLSQDGLLLEQMFPTATDLACFHNEKLNGLVAKTMKIAKEIRGMKVRTGIKAKSHPQVFLDLPASEVLDIASMTGIIETLAGCQLSTHATATVDRSNFVTVLFQLDGQICKILTPKSDMNAAYLTNEKNKILKMQMKLEKLKQQLESPKFQNFAPPPVKEKLRKRVEMLESQINQMCSANASPNGDKQNP